MFARHVFPTAILASLVILALPTSGLAAAPKKSGVYEGTLHATSAAAVSKTIKLSVSANGLRASARFYCGVGRPSNQITFPIKADGSFRGFSNTGTLTVWSVIGRFTTTAQAIVVLHLNATCDGKGGRSTLKLQ
jgi:hypothetical protein